MWGRGMLPTPLPARFSTTLSLALWVYLCKCGAAESASARTACVICPTLHQSQSCHSHASPLHPCALLPALPTGLDVCFFFYLLGVGLPCPLIFCQFWLCEEVQCVYLCHHLGSPTILKELKTTLCSGTWISEATSDYCG